MEKIVNFDIEKTKEEIKELQNKKKEEFEMVDFIKEFVSCFERNDFGLSFVFNYKLIHNYENFVFRKTEDSEVRNSFLGNFKQPVSKIIYFSTDRFSKNEEGGLYNHFSYLFRSLSSIKEDKEYSIEDTFGICIAATTELIGAFVYFWFCDKTKVFFSNCPMFLNYVNDTVENMQTSDNYLTEDFFYDKETILFLCGIWRNLSTKI